MIVVRLPSSGRMMARAGSTVPFASVLFRGFENPLDILAGIVFPDASADHCPLEVSTPFCRSVKTTGASISFFLSLCRCRCGFRPTANPNIQAQYRPATWAFSTEVRGNNRVLYLS